MAARIRVVPCIPPAIPTPPKNLSTAPTPFRPHSSTTIILSPVSSRRCWKSPLDCNPIEFLSSRAERGSNLLEVKARRGLCSRSSCQAVICHAASCFCIPDFLCAVWHCIFRRLLVCVFLCLYACFRVCFSVDCCEGYGEFPPGFYFFPLRFLPWQERLGRRCCMVSKYLVWSKNSSHFFVSFLTITFTLSSGRVGSVGGFRGDLWVYLMLRTSVLCVYLCVGIPFELWIHWDTSFSSCL